MTDLSRAGRSDLSRRTVVLFNNDDFIFIVVNFPLGILYITVRSLTEFIYKLYHKDTCALLFLGNYVEITPCSPFTIRTHKDNTVSIGAPHGFCFIA